MSFDDLRQYTLRIIEPGREENIGSGFLYVPQGEKAYVITAAHVVADSSSDRLIIEFYNELSRSEKKDYLLEVSKDDFKIHTLYKTSAAVRFDKNDVACIEIDKLSWMDDQDVFYLSNAPDLSKVLYIGYPFDRYDSDMPFATAEKRVTVKRSINKRIQIIDSDASTNLVDELEGVSGSALWIKTDNNVICLVGILTAVHGSEGLGGTLDGISTLSIIDLFTENGWHYPQSALIHKERFKDGETMMADIPETTEIDCPESVENRELSQLQKSCDQIQKQIISAISDLQIKTALDLCNSLKREAGADDSCKKWQDAAIVYQAYCYMMLSEWEHSVALLKDCGDFCPEESGLAYLMLADLAGFQNQTYYVRHFLRLAKLSRGEQSQTAFFEQYHTLLRSESTYSDDDYNKLFSLIRTLKITTKEKEQLYQQLANVSYIKYKDFDLAVKFLKQGFALRGDKGFYLAIARCYAAKALLDPLRPNVIAADKAYQNFDMYLDCADSLLSECFYRNYGLLLCNTITALNYPDAMMKHINRIIDGCSDDATLPELYYNRAQACYLLEGYSSRCFENIPVEYHRPLFLNFAVQSLMSEYSPLLDEKMVFEYEKERHGVDDSDREAAILSKEQEIKKHMAALARDIETVIKEKCCDYLPLRSKLYSHLLDIYLILKQGKEYNALTEVCRQEFPNDAAFVGRDVLGEEANGNETYTEERLIDRIEANPTPQALKELQNFYFRNSQYEKLIALYQSHLESNYEAADYHIEGIIVQYIELLSRSKYNADLAKDEFEKNRDRLQNEETVNYLMSILGLI